MKIKRELPLGEALDEIASVAQGLKASGDAVEVDGRRFKLDDRVTLEIEFEAKDGKTELEFEVKWRRGVLQRVAKVASQTLRLKLSVCVKRGGCPGPAVR